MKSTRRMNCVPILFAMLLVVSFLFMGCEFRQAPTRGAKNLSWSHSGLDHSAVPGIDSADVHIYVWNDGAAFVVWSDGAGGSHGTLPRQPGDPKGSARYQGKVGSHTVECLTTDGKTGKVKIGDTSYDLGDGPLFLVSTQDQKPRIKQLALSKLNLIPDGKLTSDQITLEYLEGIGKSDADIRQFFIEAAGQAQPQ
ncbi:MAG TPA: hypothetical protein PKB02_12950 [Anaerohalosphaeraceae bacterium]|nr:hypothetical protein [Anaerohalosphaeraceae bacterium]